MDASFDWSPFNEAASAPPDQQASTSTTPFDAVLANVDVDNATWTPPPFEADASNFEYLEFDPGMPDSDLAWAYSGFTGAAIEADTPPSSASQLDPCNGSAGERATSPASSGANGQNLAGGAGGVG